MELVRIEALPDRLDLALLVRLEPEEATSERIASVSSMNALTSRGGVLEDVLGLEDVLEDTF